MAKHAHTISGTTPRNPSRRDIAAGGIAMLVLAATAAGVDKAAELDGELLAAVAELRERDAEDNKLKLILRGPAGEENERAHKYCDEFLWDRLDELVDTIIDLPAKTPEGIRGKAWALELWLNREVPNFIDEKFEDCAESPHLLAMSLARDILGRASA
jgi:hypothetical protein